MESFSTSQVIFITIIFGMCGLCIGSFLNVMGLRLLCNESFILPRSKCPTCKKLIEVYDNIPVISYMILGGKCRNCNAKISIQYPAIEVLTALMFILTFYFFGLSLNTLFLLYFICASIVIIITDIKEELIFDIISIPLIPLGLIYNYFHIGKPVVNNVNIPLEGIGYTLVLNEGFVSAIIGCIAGFAFFEIFSLLCIISPFKQRAFGFGDTILAAALGAWFGWQMLGIILILSFLFQLVYGLPVLIMNMHKEKDYKSIFYMSILVLSMIIPLIGKFFGLTNNIWGFFIVFSISIVFALIGMIKVLGSSLKKKSFTFLPFGPALVFGSFIVIFFGQSILNEYLKYFNSLA